MLDFFRKRAGLICVVGDELGQEDRGRSAKVRAITSLKKDISPAFDELERNQRATLTIGWFLVRPRIGRSPRYDHREVIVKRAMFIEGREIWVLRRICVKPIGKSPR